VDNYSQLVFLTDINRTSHNYSHMRQSTVPNLGGSKDGNQGNNPLKFVSTVGTEVTYKQEDHVPDASNISSHLISGTSEHYIQEDYANDMGMIITTSTGGYRGNRTGVGHIQDDNNTDSQFNQTDNNMINNPQGMGIHAFGKMSELAYAVTPRKDRELWCTWGSWAGG
jgi:hypothetical protein